MCIDQANCLHVLGGHFRVGRTGNGAADNEVFLVGLVDVVPEFVGVYVVVEEVFGRTPRQWEQSLTSIPRLNPLIRSKDLCPGLLQYHNPDLFGTRRSTECPILSLSAIRQTVIHHYSTFLAHEVELHCVAACVVDCLGQEYSFDAGGKLSN